MSLQVVYVDGFLYSSYTGGRFPRDSFSKPGVQGDTQNTRCSVIILSLSPQNLNTTLVLSSHEISLNPI